MSSGPDDLDDLDALDALGALAEPHRRRLYDFVVSARRWVSREEAADASGLGRSVASHHLDRLADDGLLEIDYRRMNDRRGPGAGRPAKVYRRAATDVAVHLPPRDYELAGRLLAEAADDANRTGTPIDVAVGDAARRAGTAIGASARSRLQGRSRGAARRAVVDELGARGFEPEVVDDDRIVLHNCPFHQLAQAHTDLICGMNLCLFEGLLAQVGAAALRARLEPDPEQCCVQLVGGAD
jgi:predicted ArsR family transcriptional regulator